ncbi:MAG: acetyl-CoA carboxylase biotin carboxylase subunit [Candidatus Krumholzibacteria bacterium]|nr:acetyl-CoA carboxylase biotin carboxylase subunit [Candidatus Krumholzibacteria bacterium]
MASKIRKVLVANRGEIALRVMRALREMEVPSVAVYSDADREASHVFFADEAVNIGPAPSAESYLNIERIIEAARKSGADAVHPGYGFLSENPAFARALRDEGLTFVGPSPEAMETMGNKLSARARMIETGVRVIPGGDGPVSETGEAARLAKEIGYPVMLKAASGGGGKGMRVVRSEEELETALRDTREEAEKAFADPSVFLEKYIDSPRHVEIQVLADRHGNCVHLGERECSIQRRHQKVVEESPSPIVDASMRTDMAEMAIRVAQACEYEGAGTVEFIVDSNREFYFLEMNTRLQVEHPVTELTWNVDLVKLQFLIACGETLPFAQADLSSRGWAMEFRIYAEDPSRDFLPSTGKILRLREPVGPGIRHDSGIYEKYEIPVYYDPLLSKLVIYGESREEVIQRARRAFSEFSIGGVKTNIPFHQWLLEQKDYAEANFDTHFIDRHFDSSKLDCDPELPFVAMLAATLAYDRHSRRLNLGSPAEFSSGSRWKQAARRQAVMRRRQG